MGTAITKAASGIGGAIADAVGAPIKTFFGRSCEGVCAGTWDITCFIEHLCISNLLKLFMVIVLSYITLLFFYLMFKLGIFQCIGRSLCKICFASCETYWSAAKHITCFLWHRLKNTKRVNRRRRHPRHSFRDIEVGQYASDRRESLDSYGSLSASRKRKSIRLMRSNSVRNSRHHHHHHHHHVRLKGRELLKIRSSKRIQGHKVRYIQREATLSKRRKLVR